MAFVVAIAGIILPAISAARVSITLHEDDGRSRTFGIELGLRLNVKDC